MTDERRDTMRDSLINLCIGLRPLDGPPAVILTDPAPGFAALANDAVLAKYRLTIELGRVKNVNKDPVAEKAVRELECELLHQQPHSYSTCGFSCYCKPQHSRTKQGVFCTRVVDTTRPVH